MGSPFRYVAHLAALRVLTQIRVWLYGAIEPPARVFLKDAPIVILDEATANLDLATEAEVLANVADFARGRSVLVISHRPEALELADSVITLTASADRAPAGGDR